MAQAATVTAPPVTADRTAGRAFGLAVLIGRRLLFGALVLGAITFLTFLGLEMARGTDFAPAAAYAVESSISYLGRLLHGDLGMTLPRTLARLPVPVGDVLWGFVGKSLGLLAVSLLIATTTGMILGLLAASRRRSGWSLGIVLLSIVGVSIPSFFAALLLQLLMIRWARAFGSPLLPLGGFGWDSHIILPALVLAARPVAQITRMTFIAVGEVLGEDYVRTARGKGLWGRQVWSRHVIRNALIPILTTVGLSLRFSLSSLPVVEFFFGWPGVGFTLLRSISRQDDNLTVALILSLGVLFILVNLALELSYRAIDPRLRQAVSEVDQRERRSLIRRLRDLAGALRDLWLYNPIRAWLHAVRQQWPASAALRRPSQARAAEPEPSPFARVLENGNVAAEINQADYQAQRRRAWWRGTLGNVPFVLGLLLVVGLLGVVFLGPRLAPHNPYVTQGLKIVNGEFLVPPFDPGPVHPWGSDVLGRDVLSLILAGAQQTLLLATIVVAARLLVGFLLGALAGWLNGSWLDRAILGLAEVLAAFPALLLAMILILAIGIRQGMRSFVIALCFVGWGEIMQFVRGEVMTTRPKLFIESAVAVGLRSTRILTSHLLPILLSALISIAALEMGAVLMLLGELGFVGIFIGGGAFAELDVGGLLYHYSDVPEWGSLLSSIRAYARSYPWVAIYPALAFFIAILAFNLLGEGLRRMVETVGVGFNRVFNRYTLAVALVALLGLGWARDHAGSVAFYTQQARQFDGQRAFEDVAWLADPALAGRALGSEGLAPVAADAFAARQFAELGLQPGGQADTYFQDRSRSYTELTAAPLLEIADGGPPPVYGRDYSEYPGYYNGIGAAGDMPVRYLATGDMTLPAWGYEIKALRDVLGKDQVLLLPGPQEVEDTFRLAHGGFLAVAPDASSLAQRFTLSGRSEVFVNPITDKVQGTARPALWISPGLADRLVAPTGASLAGLERLNASLGTDEYFDLWTLNDVSLVVTGTVRQDVPVRNVIGYLPGASGRAGSSETGFDRDLPGSASQDARGGEAQMDDELIVVLAQYDSPPARPGQPAAPAANDNASGVAVLLEVLRAMRASDYAPYRSFLFVVYAGEGLDGGEPVRPRDVSKFLQARSGFATHFNVEAVVELRGLGAGDGDGLVLAAAGNQRLLGLFERAARRAGVSTSRAEETVDLSIVFDDRAMAEGGGQEAPYIEVSWEGWEATARTPQDTLEAIDPGRLEEAGEAIALALMIMGRENQY